MEVVRVPVVLGERSYDVVIGERLLEELMHFAEGLKPTSIFLITDDNVGPRHADAVRHAVVANHVLTVPPGEASKSMDQLSRLYDQVFASRTVDRHALIIALGGGVVGDLAGFLAATLMRGVRCAHIPTSLLAMVDSSVGGKTAINHTSGKNLIGAFHQPVGVFCDLHFLATLPEREYVSALAEIVKTAVIGDAELLEYLEQNAAAILARDLPSVMHVVESCVRFKADVVADDEIETSGRRATLNFGHTLAHVIETLYPKQFLHGEAVAIGTVAALRLSVARAALAPATATRVINLLTRFGLPTEVPSDLDEERMLETTGTDKKRAGDVVRFVVVSDIAQAGSLPCRLDKALADTLLGRA